MSEDPSEHPPPGHKERSRRGAVSSNDRCLGQGIFRRYRQSAFGFGAYPFQYASFRADMYFFKEHP